MFKKINSFFEKRREQRLIKLRSDLVGHLVTHDKLRLLCPLYDFIINGRSFKN